MSKHRLQDGRTQTSGRTDDTLGVFIVQYQRYRPSDNSEEVIRNIHFTI